MAGARAAPWVPIQADLRRAAGWPTSSSYRNTSPNTARFEADLCVRREHGPS